MDIKIKKKQEATSSKSSETLDITLPTSWQSLSDRQLLYFFTLLARDLPIDEIQTICLLKWANIHVCCRFKGNILVRRRKQKVWLQTRHIQAATATLDFLKQFPPFPTRITQIGKAKAVEADFQGVPFSTFIAVDNYYQGFLHTKDINILKSAAALLYPKIAPKRLNNAHILNAFYWFASLKQHLARMFPHFLQSAPADPQNLLGYAPPIGELLRSAVNAQIRALTGGDITKESAVLSMDTWRALTELDAKAKEVEDLKRKQ